MYNNTRWEMVTIHPMYIALERLFSAALSYSEQHTTTLAEFVIQPHNNLLYSLAHKVASYALGGSVLVE